MMEKHDATVFRMLNGVLRVVFYLLVGVSVVAAVYSFSNVAAHLWLVGIAVTNGILAVACRGTLHRLPQAEEHLGSGSIESAISNLRVVLILLVVVFVVGVLNVVALSHVAVLPR